MAKNKNQPAIIEFTVIKGLDIGARPCPGVPIKILDTAEGRAAMYDKRYLGELLYNAIQLLLNYGKEDSKKES